MAAGQLSFKFEAICLLQEIRWGMLWDQLRPLLHSETVKPDNKSKGQALWRLVLNLKGLEFKVHIIDETDLIRSAHEIISYEVTFRN